MKAAAFAGLVRVFVLTFPNYATDWQPIVYALAVLSLVVGAVLAIVQTNVKRMLAYSSINHAGFILVAVAAATLAGIHGGALLPGGLHVHGRRHLRRGQPGVGRTGDARTSLVDYRGLSRSNPLLALALDRLPARPGRRAVHRRVLRQVLRVIGAVGRRQALLARASSPWSPP